jgi:uncharacterized protein YpbB
MALLKAILQVPDPKYMVDGISGSFIETLKRRLPELSEARIEDLVAQLKDHRILTSGSLKAMITARRAEDMRHTLSPFGRRLVSFLSEGPQEGTA